MKLLSLFAAVSLCAFLETGNALACPGDCDDSGEVTIEDLETAVAIALGENSIGACLAADRDGDGEVTVNDLIEGVNARESECAVVPVFPAHYRDTFTQVRNCRFSIEHGGVSIRVLASPLAVQPYLEEANPLPLGSIVVKEEFSGPDCSLEDLIRWRVMRKEAPGFDADDGDWHWQWVEADRTVLLNDKTTCIACHLAPECVGRDYMCTEGGSEDLDPVLQGLPGALLSISGTGPNDVLTVGSDPPQDQFGPLVYRYDGQRWLRLNSGATGDLWWVSVEPIDGSFYMAGAGGLILRFDPETNAFERQETPTDGILFGVWGTAANDLWAVGDDDSAGGILLRNDGSGWALQDLSGVVAGAVPALYKIWGRNTDEVYAVGLQGTILRWNGETWSQLQSGTLRSLFTVHGNETQVFAVGGFFEDGVILELDGDVFEDRTPMNMPQMNGVFVPQQGQAAAAGLNTSLARHTATGWRLEHQGLSSIFDFHATWIDPEGGVWAVGGDLIDLRLGRLDYSGERTISSVIEQPPRCASGGPVGGGTVSFAGDIVPMLQQARCLDLGCHGGAFPSSGFDLSSYASAFVQGIEARALDVCPITPGDADASFLVEKLLPFPRLGAQMPNVSPPTPLSEEQVGLIRTWIVEGARDN